MAARQIPLGTPGLRPGTTGLGKHAGQGLGRGTAATRNNSRRDGLSRPRFHLAVRQAWRMSSAPHIPVLGREAVDHLAPREGGVYVDATSMQPDQAGRGLSFRLDGPLDMRMGQTGPTAADIVARASESDLADIIYLFGEERHSRRVARAIVADRQETPFTTTRALADLIGRVVRSKPGDIHPATRTFQALRIFVNEELEELQTALSAAEHVLKPGGRLVVVSFHSLEDRIVKNFLTSRSKTGGGSRHRPEVGQAAPSFQLLTRRPVIAGDEEIARNPRARSAKLRAAERTDAPAHGDAEPSSWPQLSDVMRGG